MNLISFDGVKTSKITQPIKYFVFNISCGTTIKKRVVFYWFWSIDEMVSYEYGLLEKQGTKKSDHSYLRFKVGKVRDKT